MASTSNFHETNKEGFLQGTLRHLVYQPLNRAVTLGRHMAAGVWISPEHRLQEPVTRLNPSWNVATPPGTHVTCELRVYSSGQWSGWYNMGNWGMHDTLAFKRSSVPGQKDQFGSVGDDTYFAPPRRPAEGYQVRVQLFSETKGVRPSLALVAVQASTPLPFREVTPSVLGGQVVDLDVPPFAQYSHEHEFPEFGGGRAWCCPASMAMVVRFLQAGPTPRDLGSLPSDPSFEANGRKDAEVVYAALHMYDKNYGNGNWAFATAYAGEFGLRATVRVLTMPELERILLEERVPVIVSVRWGPGQLRGASIESTNGHLMVVGGFTAEGNVITYDPATRQGNGDVRRVYDRTEFERAWRNPAGGGTALVVTRRS